MPHSPAPWPGGGARSGETGASDHVPDEGDLDRERGGINRETDNPSFVRTNGSAAAAASRFRLRTRQHVSTTLRRARGRGRGTDDKEDVEDAIPYST